VSFNPSSDQIAAWHASAADRALVQPGSKLAVHVVQADGSTLPVTGRLDFVAPSLDSATGTQEFRAKFANANGALVPGEFVHVQLDGFVKNQAITIPQRAVQQGLGRQFVYVVGAGDSVSARDIVPGPWTGHDWVIDNGLVPGDRVIVDGVQKVGPGMVVKPSPADSAAAGAHPAAAKSSTS
jgi:membrane fusion protein (multidrug efflux system)